MRRVQRQGAQAMTSKTLVLTGMLPSDASKTSMLIVFWLSDTSNTLLLAWLLSSEPSNTSVFPGLPALREVPNLENINVYNVLALRYLQSIDFSHVVCPPSPSETSVFPGLFVLREIPNLENIDVYSVLALRYLQNTVFHVVSVLRTLPNISFFQDCLLSERSHASFLLLSS